MSQRNQTYATDPLGSTTSSSGITGYPTTSAPGTTTYTSTTGYETAPGMAGTGTGYRSTEYSSTGPSTMGSAVGYEATSASGVGSGMMAGHHEGEIKPSTVGGAWDKTVGGMKEGMGRAFGATEMEAHGAEQRMEGQMEMDAAKAQKEAKGTHKVHEGQMKEAYGAPGQGVTGSMESMGGRVERNL